MSYRPHQLLNFARFQDLQHRSIEFYSLSSIFFPTQYIQIRKLSNVFEALSQSALVLHSILMSQRRYKRGPSTRLTRLTRLDQINAP